MIEEIASINATNTGYGHKDLVKIQGNKKGVVKEFDGMLEEALKEKVHPIQSTQREIIEYKEEPQKDSLIYSSKGKLIEDEKDGKHIDVSI